MDVSHERNARRKRPAATADKAGSGGAASSKASAGHGNRSPRPSWDSRAGTDVWLAHGHLRSADVEVDYVIDGWLAAYGTSVWFGAGSTGKTQLMLWMAAMIARRPEDRPEQTWLGGTVNTTGHVLILTAEDTREQIMARLRDVMTHSMGQIGDAVVRTSRRLHVMPFLSMSDEEFGLPNPSLFQLDERRVWGPSEVMLGIENYISEWNRLHTDPDDRIVGVVMDSATSMSGFDSMEAQATTNFFFHLGRLCERASIFWSIIGHTPKATSISENTYRDSAPSRLRGVAMWTTAPRMTIEVRLLQNWKSGSRIRPEAPALREWLEGRLDRRDLLVVYVAKANLRGANVGERHLARLRRGAFADVTDHPDEVLRSGVLDGVGWTRAEKLESATVGPATPFTHSDGKDSSSLRA